MRSRLSRMIVPASLVVVVAAALIGYAVWRGEAFHADTKTVYDVLFDVARILLLLLVIVLVLLLFIWLSTDDPDMVVVPFDVTTEGDKVGGRAISDSLIAELQRIRQIHDRKITGVDAILPAPYRLNGGDLAPQGEVGDLLDNIGTIGFGDTRIAIGPMLGVLRALWPLGTQAPTLRGIIQRYGTSMRLVARLEHPNTSQDRSAGQRAGAGAGGQPQIEGSRKVLSWEVTEENAAETALPEMIRTLAFQIAHRLPPVSTAESWLAFRRYTEARDAYLRFRQTQVTNALESSTQRALEAVAEEPRYQNSWNLFALAALSLANEERFASAARALRAAIPLAPTTAGRAALYLLLGNVCKMNGRFTDARDAFERAIQLEPQNPLYRNGVGYVYLRLNRQPDALNSFRLAVELAPNAAEYHVSLAGMHRRLGEDDDWAQELARARALGAGSQQESPYELAYIAAIAGDTTDAVDLLRSALHEGSVAVAWLRYDPDLDFIRDDKRFQALIEQYSPEPAVAYSP